MSFLAVEKNSVNLFAYSALAALKCKQACANAYSPIDQSSTGLTEQLKSLILWLAPSQTMSKNANLFLASEQGRKSR